MNKKKLPKAIRPTQDAAAIGSGSGAPKKSDVEDVSRAATKVDVAVSAAPDDRRTQAMKLVERFSAWSGIAGLLPVPVVDLAAVGALQIQMLRRISQIYDVPFSENRGKVLLAGLAGTMIPASAGIGLASIVKSIPVAGTAVGALATPTMAVAATYSIGMVFIHHFASGGTLLDFEPPNYREFITREMNSRAVRPPPHSL